MSDRSNRGLVRDLRLLGVGVAICISSTLLARPLFAASNAELIKKMRVADSALTKAETLYKENKTHDAAAAYSQAQDALAAIADEQSLSQRLLPLKRRLVTLHDSMELDGATLPAISASLMVDASDAGTGASTKPQAKSPLSKSPATKSTLTAKTTPKKPLGKNATLAGGAAVSFVSDVAPLLVSKCGRCHVQKSLGKVSMVSYASLIRGAGGLAVVMPGDGKGSRIYEVIESGDMPRGGGKVDSAELATLTRWIDQGAKFDGRDPNAQLTSLVGASTTPSTDEPQKLEVAMATGRDTIRFSRDIAPVIIDNCLECHGTGNKPGGNLRMSTFAELLQGGASGLELQPGVPAASLLLRKLKGLAGDRMPLKKPALSNEVIAKFEKWIAEGAHFDGNDPKETVEMTAEVYRADHSTSDQLAADRLVRAKDLWHLAVPGQPPAVKETKNFTLLGDASPAVIDEVATVAEQQATRIAQMFKAPEDKPLVKGRITLFVCRQHYDYSEFAKMVESRELPPNAQGHFRYNTINSYGVIVPPTDSKDYSLVALVGQQIAGNYIASIGRSPAWFAEGVAAATAQKLDRTDARLRGWEQMIPGIIASTPKPEAFLNEDLPAEVNDCLSMGFAKTMMSNTSRFQQLLFAIKQGQDFEKAFEQIYRLPTVNAAAAWAAKNG